MQPAELVILFGKCGQEKKCKAWLKAEVAARPQMTGVQVKDRDEFRGCEAPCLVWIGNESGRLWETVTRVTSRLLVITMDDSSGRDKFTSAVEKSCREGRASRAVEQGTV